jgi:antitoxin (DNA-binding transcriptional repressor) of toxin-antitoxin stability system
LAPADYLADMRSVALRALGDELSEYVHLAEQGETVLITDQDRVVAKIIPPQEARDPLVDNPALAEAVRKGWITPAEIVSDEPPPRLPVTTLEELLRGLDEDRADR